MPRQLQRLVRERLIGFRLGPPRVRAAFTLFEILLVLAILVIVASLALPILHGPLENQRLRKSADLLRSEWNRVRVRAMKSGRIQVFRFQIGTVNYQVQTWFADDDDLQSTNDRPPGFGNASATSTVNPAQPEVRQLPEDIMFVNGFASSDHRSARVDQSFTDSGVADQQWSRPILFYPDGTTSSAQVVLGNQRQNYIVVSLRGLTGIGQTSDLLSASELPQ